MHFHFRHDDARSLAKDFGLIAEAFADTVRGLVIRPSMDSRAARAANRDCGR